MPARFNVHLALALGALIMTLDTDAQTLSLFSAALDQQWNYGKPAESESRFRLELSKWPADDPRALVVATQIARTQSLRRQFADAHATLDIIESKLDNAPSHIRVRYLLERGRTFNSSGLPERAVPLFSEALSLAECNRDEFYAVDAAHMLGIAAPVQERARWNAKALEMTERSSDARTKRWLAPLYNNLGQAHLEGGRYAMALDYFAKALPAWEARGDAGSVRVARWMIARAQRSLGQLDEAEKAQRALLAEYDQQDEADGYVYEELAEIALARGDVLAARLWAGKAYATLSGDQGLAAREPDRLKRLSEIAGNAAPTSFER